MSEKHNNWLKIKQEIEGYQKTANLLIHNPLFSSEKVGKVAYRGATGSFISFIFQKIKDKKRERNAQCYIDCAEVEPMPSKNFQQVRNKFLRKKRAYFAKRINDVMSVYEDREDRYAYYDRQKGFIYLDFLKSSENSVILTTNNQNVKLNIAALEQHLPELPWATRTDGGRVLVDIYDKVEELPLYKSEVYACKFYSRKDRVFHDGFLATNHESQLIFISKKKNRTIGLLKQRVTEKFSELAGLDG